MKRLLMFSIFLIINITDELRVQLITSEDRLI